MNSKKYNLLKKMLVLTLVLSMLIPLINIEFHNVDASIGDGVGKVPTRPGHGHWHNAEDPNYNGVGVSKAWQEFSAIQYRKYRTAEGFHNAVNNSGGPKGGFQFEDGTYEPLLDSCKRSQFIWWYGAYDYWVDNGIPNEPGSWYTQGSGTNGSSLTWKNMSALALGELQAYEKMSSRWNGGKVVLICSGANSKPKKPKEDVFFEANTAQYVYDGSQKTVSGLKPTSKLGKIKPGHREDTSAVRSATNIGNYPVNFTKANIVDSKGKIVNDQYNITTMGGNLRITPPPIDPSEDYRCIQSISDSATAYVYNKTNGSYGFTPSGAPGLSQIDKDRYTPAGNFAKGGPVSEGDTLSTWLNWKRTFQSGSDTITPDINLQANGVSETLSIYGGVYNITRSLQKDTYNVRHCQPQTRELLDKTRTESETYYVTGTDSQGNPTREARTRTYTVHYQEWSPWEDDGERIIESSSGPETKEEKSNYQILSVNCNKEGFRNVLSSVGGKNLSLAGGDGGGALQTPEKPGAGNGVLGRAGHITGNSSFYTDGVSCKQAFNCTSAIGSSSNDSNNNRGVTPLFTEKQDGEHGLTKDGNLVFFRDNKDREVRADIWYPKPTNLTDLNSYSGSPAKRTFAQIYSGTPEIALTSIAPWKIKSNTMGSMNREHNWAGNHNSFLMKSQWSSDEGKPYKLGVNWEYDASGKNQTPSLADGYTVKSNVVSQDYHFDVNCEFKNSTGDYQASIPQTPFSVPYANRVWSPSQSIKVLFTRSVSDTKR